MRWWMLRRGVFLLFLVAVGAWAILAKPDFGQAAVVAVGGGVVFATAFHPSAPWWRGRTHLETLAPEQRRSLGRRDFVWIARVIVGMVVVAIVVSFLVAFLGPAPQH